MSKPAITAEIEGAVLQRQGSGCASCGESLIDSEYYMYFVSPWHMLPEGDTVITASDNLVALCQPCYKKVGGFAEHFKIGFGLNTEESTWLNDDDRKQVGSEWLFGEPLGGLKYKICNSPFFRKGVSFGDIIEATVDSSRQLRFKRIVSETQNSTVLLSINPEQKNLDLIKSRLNELNGLGCSGERMGRDLFSFNISTTADAQMVDEILRHGIEEEVWSVQSLCDRKAS